MEEKLKIYGFRIGDTGVEFTTREEREKAILTFTKGMTSTISSVGVKHRESDGSFSTYERNTEEVQTNCERCHGVFSVETCADRNYPSEGWGKEKWKDSTTGFICDGCMVKQEEGKKIYEAKKLLGEQATA